MQIFSVLEYLGVVSSEPHHMVQRGLEDLPLPYPSNAAIRKWRVCGPRLCFDATRVTRSRVVVTTHQNLFSHVSLRGSYGPTRPGGLSVT